MKTKVPLPLLDRVGVASPCHARWEDMTGDERTRHCAECNLRVHNISAMTRDDAEALLRASAGDRLCIRLYRRTDGTILTQDCPVGLARVRVAARRAVAKVAALIGLMGIAGVAAAETSDGRWGGGIRLRALKPFSVACEWLVPTVPPLPPFVRPAGQYLMGSRISIVPSATSPFRQTPAPNPVANTVPFPRASGSSATSTCD